VFLLKFISYFADAIWIIPSVICRNFP